MASLPTSRNEQQPTRSPEPERLVGENLISDLGWTPAEAVQVRASLQAFDADWNAPGMEEYDRL